MRSLLLLFVSLVFVLLVLVRDASGMQKEQNEPGELKAEILCGHKQKDEHYLLDEFLKNDAFLYRHVDVEFHEKMRGAVMKVFVRETGEVRNKVDLTRFATGSKTDLKKLFDKHGFVQDLTPAELKEKKILSEKKRKLKQSNHNNKILDKLRARKESLEKEIKLLKSYSAAEEKIKIKMDMLAEINEKLKRVMMQEL